MQLKKLKSLLLAPVLALTLSTPSIAGNDSVALVYLDSAQQSQQYKLESTLYKGSYGITIIIKSRSAFANIANNYKEIYITNKYYKGWIKNLQLVGNVVHGRTTNGYQVAITTF
ncbi:hypothetical protein N9W79_00400 [bacterium]|nr:hypothetical protein [bacterium]